MYINGKRFVCKRFSSGELKLLHKDLMESVKEGKVKILYDGKGLTFFELLIIIKYYSSINIMIDLVLAYLPYQRMDHNNGYEVETLKLVADILNEMKLNSLIVCEPHCELTYFKNARSVSFVDLMFNKIAKEIVFDSKKDILFFTDKGSLKRFGHLGQNYVRCEKVRDKETGLIVSYNLIGEIKKEQKIIIIDDIISTGDTILNALNELKKYTNQKIYIICGHYEKNKYNKRLFENESIEKIFSTNSLFTRQNKKLKLFGVKQLLND